MTASFKILRYTNEIVDLEEQIYARDSFQLKANINTLFKLAHAKGHLQQLPNEVLADADRRTDLPAALRRQLTARSRGDNLAELTNLTEWGIGTKVDSALKQLQKPGLTKILARLLRAMYPLCVKDAGQEKAFLDALDIDLQQQPLTAVTNTPQRAQRSVDATSPPPGQAATVIRRFKLPDKIGSNAQAHSLQHDDAQQSNIVTAPTPSRGGQPLDAFIEQYSRASTHLPDPYKYQSPYAPLPSSTQATSSSPMANGPSPQHSLPQDILPTAPHDFDEQHWNETLARIREDPYLARVFTESEPDEAAGDMQGIFDDTWAPTIDTDVDSQEVFNFPANPYGALYRREEVLRENVENLARLDAVVAEAEELVRTMTAKADGATGGQYHA